MRRLALVVLLLLLVAVPALVSLPLTESGTRFLIARLNQLESVEIGDSSGRLAGRMQLGQVNLVLGGVRIELRDVISLLDSSCLWRSAACFTRLEAASLVVTIDGSDGDDTAGEPGQKELLRWPIRVEAPAVRIGELHVEWPGGHWQQGELQAGVALYESTLHIGSGQLSNTRLYVAPSTDVQPSESPELPEIFLPMDLDVGSLTVEGFDAVVGGVEEHIERIEITGQWRGNNLHLDSVAIASALGEVTVAGEMAFANQWPLSASAGIGSLDLGEYGVHNIQANLLGDLARLNLKLDTVGVFNVSADVDLEPLEPGVPFSGGVTVSLDEQGSLADILPPIESVPDLALLSPVVAQVKGDTARQVFALEAELRGAGYDRLQLRAEGSHEGQAVLVESLSLHDSPTNSDLRASGSLNYGESSRISAVFESAGLALPRLNPQLAGRVKGSGELFVELDAQSWQLSARALQLDGEVNQLPAALSGHLLFREGGHFGDTRLQGLVNGTALKLEADPAGEASLHLQVDEFARWWDQAHGGLQLLVTRPVGSNRFSVEGQLQQPAFGSMSAEGGSLSGHITQGLDQFDLAFNLQSPDLGPVQLSSLEFNASGSLESHQLLLRSRGDIQGSVSLGGGMSDGAWQGELAPSQLDTRHGQWSLSDPVSLGWNDAEGELAVQAHCWRHPQLALCMGDAQLGASGEIQLTARGDIASFNGLVPPDLKLQGAMDASLAAHWEEGEALRLQGEGISRNVRVTRHFGLGDDVSIGWDTLSTSVEADDAGVIVKAGMEREGRRVLALDLSLPPERNGALRGQVRLEQLQLNTVAPWAPELSKLNGVLNGELQISGDLDSPRLDGPVALTGGSLALEGNPTEVTDLELQLLMRDDEVDISGNALLGGGELQVKGRASLAPELRLDLEVAGHHHQILVPPSAEMVISEDLVITITPDMFDVKGEVRVAEGVLRHEQLPAGSVALSPDVIEVDLAGNPIVEEGRRDVRSDVWIRLRDGFKVAGDSLNATVGGDLHLRQEPGRPLQLFGNLNILGGELRAYRQQLVIRRGSVAFSGSPENPELNVRAERELREHGVTVGASLQGSLEEPLLEVYSDPPMSQSEAMSYLVRGRGLDSGAGADGTSLALAMGADAVNQSGILSPVNRLPGISNVSLGSTGTDDDTAATVSGYLGERIYLSYGLGLYEPINVLTARLYLQSRFWIEVVSRLENSVDIYYSFDID